MDAYMQSGIFVTPLNHLDKEISRPNGSKSGVMSLSKINWEKLTRHFTILVVDDKSTKIKEIGPMVQKQEEQHLYDGINGPSKFTDTAVSPAIELIIGHFKL